MKGAATHRLWRGLLLVSPERPGEREELVRELEARGLEIEAAASGSAALRSVGREAFDLVICDVEAAAMDGLRLLRSLRSRDPGVPVVLINAPGRGSPSSNEAAELGAIYLEKPVGVDTLLRTAAQQLRTHVSGHRSAGARLATGITASVPASVAKNRFGRILETALSGGTVVITKHDAPTAVVISYDAYEDLAGVDAPDLDALSRDFDELLARMQTPQARSAAETLFRASPSELAKASVAEARRRRHAPERA